MSEVIVVGAGIGGLCAALRLSTLGVRVRVLEAASGPGGKASTQVLDGVEVDTGPSVLTLPEVFDALLVDAGTSLRSQVTLRAPEPAFRYLFVDGTRVDLHHDRGASLESVGHALGSTARKELDDYLEYAKQVWSAGAPHFVFARAPSMGTLLRMGASGLSAFRRIDAMRPMDRAITARVKDPYLRWILLRYATYNGSDPRSAPATLNCIAWVELGLGGYGVEGGIHALVRALETVARARGVQFLYDTPVRRIVVERRSVVGVQTDAGTLEASRVVANADVASVARDLLAMGTWSVPSIRSTDRTPSTSAYNVVVARKVASDFLVAHHVVFPDAYREEFVDLFDHQRAPRDPTVYACAPRAAHGRSGWPEHEPVFLMANAPAEPEASPEARARPRMNDDLERRMLDRAIRAGLLGAHDRVLWRRTPSDLARRFPGSRGALYGAASNDALAAFRRPPNRVAGLRGLYLASGSAHPGGGLPLCALSGRHAADEVARDLGLQPPPKGRRHR